MKCSFAITVFAVFCEVLAIKTSTLAPLDTSYALIDFAYVNSSIDCSKKLCIRKCCAANYILVNERCIFGDSAKFAVRLYEKKKKLINKHFTDFRFISGMIECENNNYYRLDADIDPGDAFYVQKDGRLWRDAANKSLPYDQFCLEYFQDIGVSALMCFSKSGKTVIARALSFLL